MLESIRSSSSSSEPENKNGESINLEDTDDEVFEEAKIRLENEGKELNAKNLKDEIRQIRKVNENEDQGTVQLLNTAESRKPVAQMNVSPVKVEEKADHVVVTTTEVDQYYARTFFLATFPERVSTGWLDKLYTSGLTTNGADVRVTYGIFPRDRETVIEQLRGVIRDSLAKLRRQRKEGKVEKAEHKQKKSDAEDFRSQLQSNETDVFDFALYLQVVAKDKEKLNDGTQELQKFFSQYKARLVPAVDQQLSGFRSMAPLGEDTLQKRQLMDVKSLSTTFPFVEPTRMQPSGVLFGFHLTTNSPIIVDPFKLSGHSILVSGKIGSGKSYFAQLLLWRMMLISPNTQLTIVDPSGDFISIVDSLGGDTVRINQDTVINPLEIKEPGEGLESSDRDPYRSKIRSVMGFFKSHFDERLNNTQEGVLRKAIKGAYLEQGITKNPRTHGKKAPTIQDVLDILQQFAQGRSPANFLDVSDEHTSYISTIIDSNRDSGSGQAEYVQDIQSKNSRVEERAAAAQQVLYGLEEFQPGGQWDNFNGQTNIDMTNQIVQFDLDNITDPNEKSLVMHVVVDFLLQRVQASDERSIVTIDEAWYMQRSEAALDMLEMLVRHSRHYNSSVMLLSQTVAEYLDGTAKHIYDQMDVKVLMAHKDLSQEDTEALGLEPSDRAFVLQQAQAGNEDNVDYSSGLILSDFTGKRRARIISGSLDHNVIEKEAYEPWTMLIRADILDLEHVPPQKQQKVSREIKEIEKQEGEEKQGRTISEGSDPVETPSI